MEAVKSVGDQVAAAAREGGGTSKILDPIKLIERMEQRMTELNTRVSKLEVLVELFIGNKFKKNSFQC